MLGHSLGRRVREVQRRSRLGNAIFILIKEIRRKSFPDENRIVQYSLGGLELEQCTGANRAHA